MGYTHYYNRPRTLCTRKVFREAVGDCRKVLEAENLMSILCKTRTDRKQACFNDSRILFNGKMDACEDFYVPRVVPFLEFRKWAKGNQPFPDFCKTRRKLYDMAVMVCIIVLKHHVTNDFKSSNDDKFEGDKWREAIDICEKHLGYGQAEVNQMIEERRTK